LDAEAAERLLSGDAAARREFRQLAERLAAVDAAGFPGELAGERTAVAAFQAAADVDLAPLLERTPMIKTTLVAKLLTLKAAAVAVAAVSLGGVALAASTGVLPNPFAPENSGHSVPAPGHTNGSDATPSPSLVGLCTAYLAGAGTASEHVLENPAFSALVSAAGDKEVADYCAELGVTPGPGHGGGSPTGVPTPSHPTGSPSHPNGSPSHPTGSPTALPTHPTS
jgi:hypothetical protein